MSSRVIDFYFNYSLLRGAAQLLIQLGTRAVPCIGMILHYVDFIEFALICLIVEFLTDGRQALWLQIIPSQMKKILINTKQIFGTAFSTRPSDAFWTTMYQANLRNYKNAREIFSIAEEINFLYKGIMFIDSNHSLSRFHHWVFDTTFMPTVSNWVDGAHGHHNRCKKIRFHPTDHFIISVNQDWKSFTLCITSFRGARQGKDIHGEIVFYNVCSSATIMWLDAVWSPCGNYVIATEYTNSWTKLKLYSFNANKTKMLTSTFSEMTTMHHLQPADCWLNNSTFFILKEPFFTTTSLLDLAMFHIEEGKTNGLIKTFRVKFPTHPSRQYLDTQQAKRMCARIIGSGSEQKIIACLVFECKASSSHHNATSSPAANNNLKHHNIYVYSWRLDNAVMAEFTLERIIYLNAIILDLVIDLKTSNLILAFVQSAKFTFRCYNSTVPLLRGFTEGSKVAQSRLMVGGPISSCPYGVLLETGPTGGYTTPSSNLRYSYLLETCEYNLNTLLSEDWKTQRLLAGIHLCLHYPTHALVKEYFDQIACSVSSQPQKYNHLNFIHSITDQIYIIGNAQLGCSFTVIRFHSGLGGKMCWTGHYARHPSKPFFIVKKSALDQHNSFDIGMMLYADPKFQRHLNPALTSFYKGKKQYKLDFTNLPPTLNQWVN